VLAGLGLVESLFRLGQHREAATQAQQLLERLDHDHVTNPAVLEAPPLAPDWDVFRVEWERAAWTHAGRRDQEVRAKRTLLRWRLHIALAELTGELDHFYEAALARPDLPGSRAALGCALGRAGRVPQALEHLRQATVANPFDTGAALAYFQALGDTNQVEAQRRLAGRRRLLAQVAPQLVPAEEWFTDVPPAPDELASIIILCCNEIDCTRQCLESVRRHTRADYELILIDNGSTDATPAYLAEVARWPEPARVVVLRNASNPGYAAGVNQGLAAARGRFLVLLNNDTVVTPHWLERLARCATHDWPHVGMVGPVSNYAPTPQHVPAGYATLDGLEKFAERHRQEYAGQALAVERLTGFCLLLRREVLQAVGGLDEGYGLGYCEDDDLCLRAQQAGFRLAVALDVFIHHHGSRTFRAVGIDCQAQLRANLTRFQEKWGPERAAGYRLPDTAPTADMPLTTVAAEVTAVSRPRVSLCMIVKNEEANLPECLASVAGLVDEVIVVDTGSTDRTREVAARFGAKVYDFTWVDSFAAARNESLRHATGQYAFWMDADDRLDEANRHKLRELFARLDGRPGAYVMSCLCLPDPTNQNPTAVHHVRLFPNCPEVRWRYRVHEQILGALRQARVTVHFTDIIIHHAGYQDTALRQRKLQRDLRLLELERQEQPDDPFTLFNLGATYQELGRIEEALPLLRRSLDLSQPGDSIVRKLYSLLVHGLRILGQSVEALALCQQGLQVCRDDVELLFNEASLRQERGDTAGAEACLLRALEVPADG
jgi:GT2 family glycosyltransferase